MSLNIKNNHVEQLLDKVIQMTGESKTEAVRKALSERLQRLTLTDFALSKEERIQAFFENEIWPTVPQALLGTTLSKEEEEAILGYGEDGL